MLFKSSLTKCDVFLILNYLPFLLVVDLLSSQITDLIAFIFIRIVPYHLKHIIIVDHLFVYKNY